MIDLTASVEVATDFTVVEQALVLPSPFKVSESFILSESLETKLSNGCGKVLYKRFHNPFSGK